mmetsp:Transcript_16467/g.33362  ORF Transcript_16467/g.33362 Transcript_16467/m.33362 type:complete len:213 (-) Transcript_16467:1497-2135(-)
MRAGDTFTRRRTTDEERHQSRIHSGWRHGPPGPGVRIVRVGGKRAIGVRLHVRVLRRSAHSGHGRRTCQHRGLRHHPRPVPERGALPHCYERGVRHGRVPRGYPLRRRAIRGWRIHASLHHPWHRHPPLLGGAVRHYPLHRLSPTRVHRTRPNARQSPQVLRILPLQTHGIDPRGGHRALRRVVPLLRDHPHPSRAAAPAQHIVRRAPLFHL